MRDDGSEVPVGRSESADVLSRLHDTGHCERNDSYASVAELNQEGALLTDEVDLDLDQVQGEVDTEGEADTEGDPTDRRCRQTRSRQPRQLCRRADHDHDHGRGRGRQQYTGDTASVRNSYGEFIRSTSNRPHLARGDSYQTDHVVGPERAGRSRQLSTEYLRSLSRSLSRDPNARTPRSVSYEPARATISTATAAPDLEKLQE